MKSLGMVRKIDKFGRVVLPMETRKLLNLVEPKNDDDDNISSYVEFYTDADSIIIKKYMPACYFCNSATDMIEYNGIKICKACLEKMNNLSKI
ncbi:MAG: AbrB/MazE/SpoVT family DNA-binding domain-containing protein [Oscillospiraceae bacterium]